MICYTAIIQRLSQRAAERPGGGRMSAEREEQVGISSFLRWRGFKGCFGKGGTFLSIGVGGFRLGC